MESVAASRVVGGTTAALKKTEVSPRVVVTFVKDEL
jgi:hypothetical protein